MAKSHKIPTYQINENGINLLLTEDGNAAYMLRQVSWNGRSERLELRKWHTTSTGEEIPGKGISFKDKSKVDEVVETLTKNNFGKTESILKNLNEREDFEIALANTIGQKKIIEARNTELDFPDDECIYFDPKNYI